MSSRDGDEANSVARAGRHPHPPADRPGKAPLPAAHEVISMTRTSKHATRRKAASRIEAFNALPDAEKERQTAVFDQEFIADQARPLTPAQRKLWNKAKRRKGPGRPKKGEGVKTIALSVEKGLLRRTDALAKRRKMTRADLVAQALEETWAKA